MADMGFMPAVTALLDMVPAGRPAPALLRDARPRGRQARPPLPRPPGDPLESYRLRPASVATMEHHVLARRAPRTRPRVTAEIGAREGRTILFVRTKHGADRVATQLPRQGVPATSIHGGKPQGARTRALAEFREGRTPVLVATDVAARGIHVDNIGLVVHVDPPVDPKDYLHRAGRTARAGESGTVVTLVLPHQEREVDKMAERAGVKPSGAGPSRRRRAHRDHRCAAAQRRAGPRARSAGGTPAGSGASIQGSAERVRAAPPRVPPADLVRRAHADLDVGSRCGPENMVRASRLTTGGPYRPRGWRWARHPGASGRAKRAVAATASRPCGPRTRGSAPSQPAVGRGGRRRRVAWSPASPTSASTAPPPRATRWPPTSRPTPGPGDAHQGPGHLPAVAAGRWQPRPASG